MKTLDISGLPDALGDIISIGTSCAAQSLSQVIDQSVQLSIPNVSLVKIEDVSVETLRLKAEVFGVVTQEFTGALNTKVMLLFAEEAALQIVENMIGMEMDRDAIREIENEAMCELGNIMINACLSSVADTLHISIESSLPHYVIQSRDEIVTTILHDKKQDFVLISSIDLVIEQCPIEGKLLFLMNKSCLNNVIDEIHFFVQTK